MYPSPAELLADLAGDGVDACVERLLADDVPFAFEGAPEQLEMIRLLVLERLGVAPSDVTVVGSGRFGFSMDPDRWGVPFSDGSDIDLVVVSADLYHRAWVDLGRNWRRAQMGDPKVLESVKRHRNQLIFFGRMIPYELLGITPVARVWLEAFAAMSDISVVARRDVRAHLWHCWEPARLYYRNSLGRMIPEGKD